MRSLLKIGSLLIIFLFLLSSCIISDTKALAVSNTYYLSPIGNDNNSGISEADAWKTFDRAVNSSTFGNKLQPGDTLVLLDGTYNQSFRPNYVGGQSGNPITIVAKNDGKAIIDGQNIRTPIHLEGWRGASYYVIKGIVAKNSSGPVIYTTANNNTFQRVSAYNANTNDNQEVIIIWADNTLLEDCVASGTGRKMILVFSAVPSSGNSNIIRRCFSVPTGWDGRNWHDEWPWGDTYQAYGSDNNIFENDISYGYSASAGFSLLSNDISDTNTGNKILGSIALMSGADLVGNSINFGNVRPQPTTYTLLKDMYDPSNKTGLWLGSSGKVQNVVIQDFLGYGNAGMGLHLYNDPNLVTYSNININRITLAHNGLDFIGGTTDTFTEDLQKVSITNSKINSVKGSAWNHPTGSPLVGEGARLQNRYVNGILTEDSLWPWPMEQRIRDEMGLSVTNLISDVTHKAGIAVPVEPLTDTNIFPNSFLFAMPISNPFGTVSIGTTSAQLVTLKNLGTAPLTVDSYKFDITSYFSVVPGGSCTTFPFILNAGQSCTISVAFSPQTTQPQTNYLYFNSSDVSQYPQPSRVYLSGIGSSSGITPTTTKTPIPTLTPTIVVVPTATRTPTRTNTPIVSTNTPTNIVTPTTTNTSTVSPTNTPVIPTQETVFARRVNVPNLGTYPPAEGEFTPAIFWFGKVGPESNYADVRAYYYDTHIGVILHIIDRHVWYDTTPSVETLIEWDSVSLYFNTNTDIYRFDGQLNNGESRENWQAVYRKQGNSWIRINNPFTTEAFWRGDSINSNATEDRGWSIDFKIPFSSLGIQTSPQEGTIWGFSILLHDRDSLSTAMNLNNSFRNVTMGFADIPTLDLDSRVSTLENRVSTLEALLFTPTFTPTIVPTSTNTNTPNPTFTATNTLTSTPTNTPIPPTNTPTFTNTPIPPTNTPTVTPTLTIMPTNTFTNTPTPTIVTTNTPTVVATLIPNIIPDQVWPEDMDINNINTWGELRFGIPTYESPAVTISNVAILKDGINGIHVLDGEVGGHTDCSFTPNLWNDIWNNFGNQNYNGYEQINIQNQWDISDFGCFSKYYMTVPLNSLPVNKKIVSATLTMTAFGCAWGSQPSYIQVGKINQIWDENTLSWNSAPLLTENTSGTWIACYDAWVPHTWDISKIVNDAYVSNKPLQFVLYTPAGEYHSGKYFWSNDASQSAKPFVTIYYGDPVQ